MTDKDTQIRRGYAAKRILEDAEVMAAFGEIEQDLFNNWFSTNPQHVDEREGIYRQVKALEYFQQKLETWRNNILHLDAVSAQSKRDAQGVQAEA